MSRAADFDALSDYDKAGLSLNAILRCVSRGRVRKVDYEPLMYATELAAKAVIASMPHVCPEESDTPELIELVDFINYYGDGLRNNEAFSRHAAWLAKHQQSDARGEREDG